MVYQRIHICHIIVSNRYGNNVIKTLIDVILRDKNVLYRYFFIYSYFWNIFFNISKIFKKVFNLFYESEFRNISRALAENVGAEFKEQ